MRTTEQYLEKLKIKRFDKGTYYDYGKVSYIGNSSKIHIICPIHGEFWQRAGDHLAGRGCEKCGRENAKITNIEKYGVDNPSKSKEIKKKIKEIFIEKYGVDNPSKVESIKKQKEQTCIENHGVTSPQKSNKIRDKTKRTNLEKYGVEYPMQNEHISVKGIKTKIENGGFTKSNTSLEATLFIREYIKTKGYNISQCAYADEENNLYEWGIYNNNGKWMLYDLVVFETGFRGDSSKIIEILEYNGPFHYTEDDVRMRGNEKAYPWKSNISTVEESYNIDRNKEKIAKELTENFTIIWAEKWHK